MISMSKKIESIYLHVPFCKHLCNYCDFYKKSPTQRDGFDQYEALLKESWQVQQKMFDQNNLSFGELETFYMGGGTPSFWSFRGIDFLSKFFSKHNLKFSKEYEFTLEIDPATTTIEELKLWWELGVNRYSIGLQTWDAQYLKVIDRIHTVDQAIPILNYLAENNLNYSVDFMLGFPEPIQKKRNIKNELEEILKFKPSHISLYILSVSSKYPHFKILPQDDVVAKEYLLVNEFLRAHHFDQYEVSNYSKEMRRSKHNIKYWGQESVAAFGPSASGFIKFDQGHALRYKWNNLKPVFTSEKLNLEQIKLEAVYTGLRSYLGVQLSEFTQEAMPYFEQWESKKLAKVVGNRLFMLPSGYVILDTLIGQVLAFIK